MTLLQLIRKFYESEDGLPEIIRRTSWEEEDCPYPLCFPASGCFYTSKSFDKKYPFSNEDILADDWEYSRNEWRSK